MGASSRWKCGAHEKKAHPKADASSHGDGRMRTVLHDSMLVPIVCVKSAIFQIAVEFADSEPEVSFSSRMDSGACPTPTVAVATGTDGN